MVEQKFDQPPVAAVSSPVEWLGNYAQDVWNKPQDHLLEIGAAGVVAAAALTPLGRMGIRALGERGAAATLPEVTVAGTAAGESVMSAGALKAAVGSVRNLSYEVDAGFSTLVGKVGPNGERLLATADGNAFRLRPLGAARADDLFAHELVLPPAGDKFTARFLIDSQHQNTWQSLNNPVWPAGKNGIFSSLQDAGVSMRSHASTPLKLEFGNDLSRLDIAATGGKGINVGIDNVLSGKGTTTGFSSMSNQVAGITIDGPSAVRNGRGLIDVRNPQWAIERSALYGYPEVPAGGNLRIFYDPLASVRPTIGNDVRVMTKTSGLVGQ